MAFVAVQPAALNSQPLRRRAPLVSEIHLRAHFKLGVANLIDPNPELFDGLLRSIMS